MLCTPYSAVPAQDLVEYTLSRDNRTELEIELAQRLQIALDMIAADNNLFPRPQPPKHGHDA